MQIIIEIPESKISKRQDIIEIPLHFMDGEVCEAGGYRFDVLPKGHGKLIDADALKETFIEPNIYLKCNEKGFWCFTSKEIKNAPTIIEADKEMKYADNN